MQHESELPARIARFIAPMWPDAQSIQVANVQRILGGWSKRMYAFDAEASLPSGRAQLPLILRINAPDNAAILRNDRRIEHDLLQRLRRHTALPVPLSHVVDTSGEHFGAQALVMERLPGNARITSVPQEQLSSIAEHLVELLAELHTAPTRLLNPDGLLNDPNGWSIRTDTWDNYIDSSCQAWIDRYEHIAFDALPVVYDTFLSLRRQKPRPLPLVVLHGELNPNNLITADGKVVGLIDWERPHLGDPREDLAYFKYFERAMAGTHLFQSVTRDGGFLGYYNRLTGYGVTEQELDYFTLFSHADVSYGPYSSIQRGLAGQHHGITAAYFIAETIHAQFTFSQLLGYAR